MTRVWFNKTFSNVRAVFDLVRAADSAGEFRLICTHTKPEFPGFLSAHEWAVEPPNLGGSAYLAHCLDFCRERRIDLFIPGKEANPLAHHAADFAAVGTRLCTPAAPDALADILDKARFYRLAERFSVPPPAFREVASLAEFDTAYAELREQHDELCIKPIDGVNGAGFRVIDERHGGLEVLLHGTLYTIDLASLRGMLATAGRFKPLLLMEFLAGSEYSIDCVGNGSGLVAAVQRRKPAAGHYGQRIVDEPELTGAVAELAEAFQLRGLFNVQFRRGRGGFRVLEINPRFSGGIGVTGESGVNLPYLALRGLRDGFANLTVPHVRAHARILEQPSFLRIED